jgi:glutamate-1-semialdehyde 2,1-aminomutase
LANAAARRLRNELNRLFAAHDWPWVAYGDFSMVRVVSGYIGDRPRTDAGDNDGLVPFGGDVNMLDGPKNMRVVYGLRQAMLLHGVDWWGLGGMTTCEHTDAVIDHTVQAFEAAVEAVIAERLG